jgi:hypothetical protein
LIPIHAKIHDAVHLPKAQRPDIVGVPFALREKLESGYEIHPNKRTVLGT